MGVQWPWNSRKKSYKFKSDNKNVTFSNQFCLGTIYIGFGAAESGKVSLKGNVNNFSVDYNVIDKSEISNIHKYFMVTNNTK